MGLFSCTTFAIQYRAEGRTHWTSFGTYNLIPGPDDIAETERYLRAKEPQRAVSYEIRVVNPHGYPCAFYFSHASREGV